MIEEFNPWWLGEKDRDIEEFEDLKYKYYPDWIHKISLEPFSLNFVYGPRKVGKTTGIKLLINELLKRVKSPYEIFFFRVDFLDNYRELYNVLKEYNKIKEEKGIDAGYIFLDEITLLEDWWKGLKVFIDEYKPKDVFVLSGSVSMFFYGRAETFGGRRGKGRIIEVHPINFSEFYKLFHKEYFDSLGKDIFQKYLKYGGYLGVLNGKISEEDVVLFLKSDLRLVGRSPEIAKDILRALLKKAPSPFGFNSLGKEVGISSRTAMEYIYLLKKMFLILDVMYKGMDGKVYPRKERKYIIRDPFLSKAISLWVGEDLRKDFLYEWIVQEHLYRKFGEIYYYRNKYEIDCIAGNLKIEVKAGKPHRRYPRNVVVLEKEDIPRFLIELSRK